MAESYRAEQVGSLLRPPALLEARAAHEAGRISADELRQAEDRAILEALEQQRQAGMDVLVDGEYRRFSFMTDMVDAVEGFVPTESNLGTLADIARYVTAKRGNGTPSGTNGGRR